MMGGGRTSRCGCRGIPALAWTRGRVACEPGLLFHFRKRRRTMRGMTRGARGLVPKATPLGWISMLAAALALSALGSSAALTAGPKEGKAPPAAAAGRAPARQAPGAPGAAATPQPA